MNGNGRRQQRAPEESLRFRLRQIKGTCTKKQQTADFRLNSLRTVIDQHMEEQSCQQTFQIQEEHPLSSVASLQLKKLRDEQKSSMQIYAGMQAHKLEHRQTKEDTDIVTTDMKEKTHAEREKTCKREGDRIEIGKL